MSRSLIIDIIFTYIRPMKWIASILLCVCASLCFGDEAQTLYDLKVNVQRNGGSFLVKAPGYKDYSFYAVAGSGLIKNLTIQLTPTPSLSPSTTFSETSAGSNSNSCK